MNYSEQELTKKQNMLLDTRIKWKNRLRVSSRIAVIVLLIAFLLLQFFCVAGVVKGVSDSTPSLSKLDLLAKGTGAVIYDEGGNELQTLSTSSEQKEYVKLDKIPACVQYAFVAAVDSRFYEHKGVDLSAIFQEFVDDLSEKDQVKSTSTITQQLLRNQVIWKGNGSSVYEKITRKIQEQYLAVQLEQKLDKEQILEYYLNTINLGQNAIGVQNASMRYFNKDISQLSISEAAVLAGTQQNPTDDNPITNPENNSEQRKKVLKAMLDQNYISEEDYEDALGDDVYTRVQTTNQKKSNDSESGNSYYVDAVIDNVFEDLKEKLGYTETQAYNALYRDGLRIYSCQDEELQSICDKVIGNDANYPTGTPSYLTYHLAVEGPDGTVTEYTELDLQQFYIQSGKEITLYFDNEQKAKHMIAKFRKAMTLGGAKTKEETIRLVKQPQASFVLMEQGTGKVRAIVGGRGGKTSSRTLNRATSSVRQPGTVLSTLSSYLPALDTCGMTLGTVVEDAPYRYTDTDHMVQNTAKEYGGLTTIRDGLANSVNTVTARIFEKVTAETGFDYLKQMRFSTLVDARKDDDGVTSTDIKLSAGLGELTDGVTNLELTAAYASIADGGVYREPIFYTKVVDEDGNVLLSSDSSQTRVMKASTSWMLTDVLQETLESGDGRQAAFDDQKMAVAGKNGVSKGNYDFWFEGFTPYYTAGIWTGYDGTAKQDNTYYYQKIWKKIMTRVHKAKACEAKKFAKPDDIISVKICTKCGNLAVPGLCENALGGSTVRKEYFAKGTQPLQNCSCHVKYKICKKSGKAAAAGCPDKDCEYKVYLKKEDDLGTKDAPYLVPKTIGDTCKLHAENEKQ